MPAGADLSIAWGFETGDRLFKGYDTDRGLPYGLNARSLSTPHAKGRFEKNDNLSPRRATKPGRFAGFPITPKFALRPDVDTVARWMMHYDRKYSVTNLTGAYRVDTEPWLRGTDPEPSPYVDSMSWQFDAGDGRPVLHHGIRIPSWGLKIQDGKLVDMTVDLMGCRDTYVGTVAEVAVAGAFTGRVIAFGHRNDPTSTDAIKVKCYTAGGSGVAKVRFTKGATAYGTTDYTVTYGTPIRVKLAADEKAGISFFDDFYVLFLDAAGGGSVLTLNDEWTIPATRSVVTPTYSTKNPLMTAGCVVTIAGKEYSMRNVEVAAADPLEAYFGTLTSNGGGLYARTLQKTGNRSMRFIFDRDAEDLEIYYKMKKAEQFAIQVDIYGDPIGATAFDERWKIAAAAAQVTNLDRDVPNQNTLPEKIEVEAVDNGVADLYTQQIWCGVSAP